MYWFALPYNPSVIFVSYVYFCSSLNTCEILPTDAYNKEQLAELYFELMTRESADDDDVTVKIAAERAVKKVYAKV